MTGVELPDYSGVYVFVCIVIALAATICAATPAVRDSKLFNYFTRRDEKRSLDNMEGRLKNVQYGTPIPKSPNCGFLKPGVWFCNCGKVECEAFGKLAEAVGATDGTPPVHPKPDRKAAIEHSRNK